MRQAGRHHCCPVTCPSPFSQWSSWSSALYLSIWACTHSARPRSDPRTFQARTWFARQSPGAAPFQSAHACATGHQLLLLALKHAPGSPLGTPPPSACRPISSTPQSQTPRSNCQQTKSTPTRAAAAWRCRAPAQTSQPQHIASVRSLSQSLQAHPVLNHLASKLPFSRFPHISPPSPFSP